MKRFYQKLFFHNQDEVPSFIENKFRTVFHHPIGVEWMVTGDDYEALFHENKLEQIARFNQKGNLVELRTNIYPLDIATIKNEQVNEMGALMNYIQIKQGTSTTHELIIKKTDSTRMLVLLNDKYEIIKQEIL